MKLIAYTWGSTAEERQMVFPCDRYIENSDEVYFRAINVKAPAFILWRWLCQLRVASYSYDFLDRLERIFFEGQERIPSSESPDKLIPGLEILAPDQRFMGVFKLVEFETNRHLTMIMDCPKSNSNVRGCRCQLRSSIYNGKYLSPHPQRTRSLSQKYLWNFDAACTTMGRLINDAQTIYEAKASSGKLSGFLISSCFGYYYIN
jgi:hypothetical protein